MLKSQNLLKTAKKDLKMKNIDFKRIALKTLKFVIIFVITDFLFGTLASKLFFNQETGKFEYQHSMLEIPL